MPPRAHDEHDRRKLSIALRVFGVLLPLLLAIGQRDGETFLVFVAITSGLTGVLVALRDVLRRRLWLRRVRRGTAPGIRLRLRLPGERLDGLLPLVGNGRDLVIEHVEDPDPAVYRAMLVKTPLALL